MKKELVIVSTSIDASRGRQVASFLKKEGYEVSVNQGQADLTKPLAILLSADTSKESLLQENPWIAQEDHRSGTPFLRVLPLIVYDSRKEKLEDVWENNVQAIYRALFSDEFKPFAFDVANEAAERNEFLDILAKN